MLKIGITGGIGSGKSLVSNIFRQLGIPVYNSDEKAKWLMTNDSDLKDKIKKHFGNEAYSNDTDLNRSFLAKVVFNNPEKTKVINSLVHPAVGVDFKKWSDDQTSPYILKEAALLIQSGSYKQLDYLILVKAPEELRIQRVLARDNQRSREDIMNIISRQMSEAEMEEYSDYVLDNDNTKPLLKEVLKLHDIFRS